MFETEPTYNVNSSHNGKGQIIASPHTIGQNVFICDSKSDHVIKATIEANIHNHNIKSEMGMIELPEDWIGKRLHIRPFIIISG